MFYLGLDNDIGTCFSSSYFSPMAVLIMWDGRKKPYFTEFMKSGFSMVDIDVPTPYRQFRVRFCFVSFVHSSFTFVKQIFIGFSPLFLLRIIWKLLLFMSNGVKVIITLFSIHR